MWGSFMGSLRWGVEMDMPPEMRKEMLDLENQMKVQGQDGGT
jgi:hypothetical protein